MEVDHNLLNEAWNAIQEGAIDKLVTYLHKGDASEMFSKKDYMTMYT